MIWRHWMDFSYWSSLHSSYELETAGRIIFQYIRFDGFLYVSELTRTDSTFCKQPSNYLQLSNEFFMEKPFGIPSLFPDFLFWNSESFVTRDCLSLPTKTFFFGIFVHVILIAWKIKVMSSHPLSTVQPRLIEFLSLMKNHHHNATIQCLLFIFFTSNRLFVKYYSLEHGNILNSINV